MKKRWIAYAAWLLSAALLYFFENNTGTRVVLLCSLLFPFIPPLRSALFSPDEPVKEDTLKSLTVSAFTRREPDDPGDIRPYVPGDPVRRIHWKLSAKKDELLVRDSAAGPEAAEEERKQIVGSMKKKKTGGKPAALLAAGMLLCILLLLLIPEAKNGTRALCNRLFVASEAVNRYTYTYFTVPGNQSVSLSAVLLLCILLLLLAVTAVSRSRLMALGIMAACALLQIYFGLSFPAWVNIPLYGLLAAWMLRRPVSRKSLITFGVSVLLVTLPVLLFLPGVDAATEEASEKARDRLAEISEQITGAVTEASEGETETRHIHTRSLESGDREAETEQEFRLVTVEEQQISMPHWINWAKAVLMMMLAIALVIVPFTPFLLLNARKKKALEIRKTFESEDVPKAVCAIFCRIVLWFDTLGCGAGNRLYRDWSGLLPDALPEGYADRFSRCAADYEEAAYSTHSMPEQARRNALDLLKETETALWKTAGLKQRLYLKYWMCLHE